jgi:hypothetical protein
MKLPFTIDLRNPGGKQFVDNCIARHGKRKAINEVGLSVQCVDAASNAFEIVQFNSSRHLATFGASATVPIGATA